MTTRTRPGERQAKKLQRRRELLTARMAAAQTPGERIAVMLDYLRAALANADKRVAESIATTVIQDLETQAEQLIHQTTTGLRPGGDTP